MSDDRNEDKDTQNLRIKLTASITIAAYDAITEIQRDHRRKTGKVLPIWKILDAALVAYARKQGIKIRE